MAYRERILPAAIFQRSAVERNESTENLSKEWDLVDETANHSAFITLLQVLDTARKRKTALLDAIVELRTLGVAQLPFGDGTNTQAMKPAFASIVQQHLSWLHSNLFHVDRTLHRAYELLQKLYANPVKPVGYVSRRYSQVPLTIFSS